MELRLSNYDCLNHMAFLRYEFDAFYHRVFQPRTTPQTHHPPPRSVQIELTFALDFLIFRHDCITGYYTDSNIGPISRRETIRFNANILRNRDQAYQILVPTLTRIGFYPNPHDFNSFMDEIIECSGLRIGDETSDDMQPQVLSLRYEFWGSVSEHIVDEELYLEDLESEIINYGMVPAKESSVKTMLKKVRVESGDCENVEVGINKNTVKGEDCVICLEEIEVGLDASRMPCNHTFHSSCIETWLQHSHYCPVCRFKMPT